MKRTSVPRRLLAVAASAFIGLVGAVALAAPASAHHTYVTGIAECPDPGTGTWAVSWTVTSWQPRGGQPDQYRIIDVSVEPAGVELPALPLNENRHISEAFEVRQELPAEVTSVVLTVRAEWGNGQQQTNRSQPVEQPAPCEEEPPPPEEVQVPIAWGSDCESLTVQVTNPLEDGDLEATVASGETSETLVIAPGETAEVTFPGGEGTVATVTIGEESEDFAWELPEGGCDEEPEEGQGGGDEELPLTGSSTMLIAGGALALLVLGGGLFLLARRRRVTFTA